MKYNYINKCHIAKKCVDNLDTMQNSSIPKEALQYGSRGIRYFGLP
jgi:hypothetical protein